MQLLLVINTTVGELGAPRSEDRKLISCEMTVPCSSNHSTVDNDCTLQCGNKITVKQIFANCSVCTALVSSDDNVCLQSQSPLSTVDVLPNEQQQARFMYAQ